MKKSLIIAGSIATVGLASVAGAHAVSAHTGDQSDIAGKIATKFNLNKGEVQKVFDENHAERHAKMEQKMHDRLTQAVKDGKLTQEKADQLEAKIKEIHSLRESLKGKTPQERHETMKAKIDELKKWADDNDIPEELQHFPRFVMGGGHGKEMPKAE